MTRAFRRADGGIVWSLHTAEADLIGSLIDGVRLSLGGDEADPVVARLTPRAVTDDDDADHDLRAMLRDELLARHAAHLTLLAALLQRGEHRRGRLQTTLVDDEPAQLLAALNSLRIATAARVPEDALEREGEIDEAVAYRLTVMDHLGWMQEQLLAILDPSAVVRGEDDV